MKNEVELEVQMSHFKSVLNIWCTTKAAKKRLETADLLSKEHSGSQIPLYVCYLRKLNLQFHKRLDGLIQFPGENKSNSVHIVCQEFSDPLLFDVHFEQKKVLEDLSFPCTLVFFLNIISSSLGRENIHLKQRLWLSCCSGELLR